VLRSKHFSFLHVPRTGGTWVEEILRAHAPKEWRVRRALPKHGGVEHVPPGGAAFAFVRDPRTWYRSWYAFHEHCWMERDYANGLGRAMYDEAPDARTRCYAAHFENGRGFLAALPWMTYAEPWSGHVRAVVGEPDDRVMVLRYEALRDNLGLALATLIPGKLPASLRKAIYTAPPTFESYAGRAPLDREAVTLIRERDGELAARFGYDL